MFTAVSAWRRAVAGLVLAASVVLGGCATYPESYYYGDARRGGDYYYDEPYRAVDRYDAYYDPFWGGGWYYYSALWPVYSRWYDPWYFPGYYYGVTYFPRAWYGFSFTYYDFDPWWYRHHYAPYRYSWCDNYYAWHHYRGVGRHDYRDRYSGYRYGSARAEAERLAAQTQAARSVAYAGALQVPDSPWARGYAERARVRDAGGRGRDAFADPQAGYRDGTALRSAPLDGRRAATRDAEPYAGPRGAREELSRYPATRTRYDGTRYDGTRHDGTRDAGAPITRDATRAARTQPLERDARAGWRAGPREDSTVERYTGSRGLPAERGGARDRATPAYGRATESGYTPRRAAPREGVYDSPTRYYSRDREARYETPRYETPRYETPRYETPRYQAPPRDRYEAPARAHGRYEAPGGGYAVSRDPRGYAAPSGGYAAPRSAPAPRGGGHAASSGGGWSAPAPSASAPAARGWSGGDTGGRSADRGRDRDDE
jgi:hypothetical protein